MSRVFNGSSDRGAATPPLTAYPATLAGWFRTSSAGLNTLMALTEGASDKTWARVGVNYPAAGNLYAQNYQPGQQGLCNTSNTFVSGQWFHACAVFPSGSSRTVYLNGDAAGAGTNTTVVSTFTPTHFTVGALAENNTYSGFHNGEAKGVALWSVELSSAEIALLATGVDPRQIRPECLVWLMDDTGADLIGTKDITWTGTIHGEEPPVGTRPVLSLAHLWGLGLSGGIAAVTLVAGRIIGTWTARAAARSIGVRTIAAGRLIGTWTAKAATRSIASINLAAGRVIGTWTARAATRSIGTRTISAGRLTGTWTPRAAARSIGTRTLSAGRVIGTWTARAGTAAVSQIISAGRIIGTWTPRAGGRSIGTVTLSAGRVVGTWTARVIARLQGVGSASDGGVALWRRRRRRK